MNRAMSMVEYFQGSVKIKVERGSKERFLNLCHNQEVVLHNIEKTSDQLLLNLSVKDYRKLRPIARKTNCRITIMKKSGFPFLVHKFSKRKIFLSGMILSVAAIYILSLYIWNIHIEGNVSQTTGQLIEYLDTIGVSHGTLKRNIICEELETKLRSKYPNILWISAEIQGTRIILRIKENTDKDIIMKITPESAQKRSIISQTSGIVNSIIVRKGTPLVRCGDEVTAGQTLVGGYYEIKNDAQEIVRYETVDADADVEIFTETSYYDEFSTEYTVKTYTKKRRLGCTLTIGKKEYRFHPKQPFEHFDVITKNYNIHITENFYLPFSIELSWYREYIPKPQVHSRESLKKVAEQRFSKKYKNILQKGVQIIEKDVKINTNGKLCLVRGTVKLMVPQTYKMSVKTPGTETKASLEGDY